MTTKSSWIFHAGESTLILRTIIMMLITVTNLLMLHDDVDANDDGGEGEETDDKDADLLSV